MTRTLRPVCRTTTLGVDTKSGAKHGTGQGHCLEDSDEELEVQCEGKGQPGKES